MPAKGRIYAKALEKIVKQEMNLATADIRVLLVSPTYTYNKAHEFVSNITNEVTNESGTGYARKQVANVTITLAAGAGLNLIVDCNDIEYTAINTAETIRAAIFYVHNANDNAAALICSLEGLALATNGSDVTLRIPETGIIDFEGVIE